MFISQIEIHNLKGKLTEDLSQLGKIYKAKKSKYQTQSIDHSLVDDMVADGWEIEKTGATKTKIRRLKIHSRQFEDDVWCQFYELGYRHLNYDETCCLPFSPATEDKKQIDIVALDKETVFLVECKSSEKLKKAPPYRDIFETLGQRLDGFRKVIEQAFGKGLKVKYIFATRNLQIDIEDIDFQRLAKTGSFYYNDNTYDYINSLIKNYKGVSRYQLLGLIFKNELINLDKIEVPAVKGEMGGKSYYMFSIEPSLLLKMGYVLHRTRANEAEFPTYQRLLVPTRLAGITKYINSGGYFPNSIILNFSQRKHEVQFEPSSRTADSAPRFGILKIPNAYAIAYIIDGQHRLYGYANSLFKETNTIPVVAFTNLSSNDQLEIFMDINQNQKAVSPSLRLDLEEDLLWGSDRADSRLKALKSSIVKGLSNTSNSPLFNKISIGEDSSMLPFKPFYDAITASSLLPIAKGNKYDDDSIIGSLYNINNQVHEEEMLKAKKSVVQFLMHCYSYVQENYPEIFDKQQYFIISPRGTYAFITLLGSLNLFLSKKGNLTNRTLPKDRFLAIEKYLKILLDYLLNVAPEEESKQLSEYGTGAGTKWLRFFQTIINSAQPEYNPPELKIWLEMHDEQLQDEGRKFGVAIEKKMKKIVLEKIKLLYKDNWELEINSIKRECMKRAEEEKEKNYKEGLSTKNIEWTEMFNINDYKTIIDKYWTKTPEDPVEKSDFFTFEKEFSIDTGNDFHSKADKIRWISFFNSYRNLWAHEGTKEKRLNKEEVNFLQKVHKHFENK
ncbi:MAG: DGQHR domain-containing protein [Pedobacter sp.]|nr:DGQHR domain-containing protein [Pedobacter sp.]